MSEQPQHPAPDEEPARLEKPEPRETTPDIQAKIAQMSAEMKVHEQLAIAKAQNTELLEALTNLVEAVQCQDPTSGPINTALDLINKHEGLIAKAEGGE